MKFLILGIILFCSCARRVVVNEIQIPPIKEVLNGDERKVGIGGYFGDFYLDSRFDEFYVINKLNKGVYLQVLPISPISFSLLYSSKSIIPSISSFLKFKNLHLGVGGGANFFLFLSPYIYLYLNVPEKDFNYYFHLAYLTTPNEIEYTKEGNGKEKIWAKGYGGGFGFNCRIYKPLFFTLNFKAIYLTKGLKDFEGNNLIDIKKFLTTINTGLCISF